MKKINTTVFWKVPGTYFSLLSFIEIGIRVMALIMWNNISGKFFWLELFKVYISLVLHDNDRYPALMIYAFEKKNEYFSTLPGINLIIYKTNILNLLLISDFLCLLAIFFVGVHISSFKFVCFFQFDLFFFITTKLTNYCIISSVFPDLSLLYYSSILSTLQVSTIQVSFFGYIWFPTW